LHASGDILGVLNADDFLLPDCLATVADEFSANPAADVIAGHGYFASSSGELGVSTFSDPWSWKRFCHGACVLVQPATFFRRAAFEQAGGFRLGGGICWDMELWADLAQSGAQFHSIDAFLAAFRLHGASITGRPELRTRRRQDAHAVLAQIRGRSPSRLDQFRHYFYRFLKFSRHPARTLRQRLYFHSTLQRWSL
jgi:hypothetical protein